ncbi:MAG: formylglycine-generating enzyme family protein [Thermomonas sp.]|uniref:formylglycine-generating enzyme family protein n=1 Tax=Thermomonas sp. TaxID=1971895 RepID=UPI0039E4CEB3
MPPALLEHGLRAVWPVIAVILSLALAGCKPAPTPPVEDAPAVEHAAQPEGRVRISGDDALADVLSWSLPQVEITDPAQARKAARKALAAGDLFENADSAIPLLMALQRVHPGDAGDARLLEQARDALLAQAKAALDAADDDASLQFAQRHGTVLRALWPQLPEVQAYLVEVDKAGQARDLALSGERALRAGSLDEDGGALQQFRAAQRLHPLQRAEAGIEAVEAALLAEAEAQATGGDFDAAAALLTRAAQVRRHPQTIADARARIDVIRANRVRRLRDEGLIALGDADGLRAARQRLAEMLRIAPAGDPASSELRERIDLATHYGLFRPGQVFTDGLGDGSRGPQLVVVPHGAFLMGAPEGERDATPAEQPQHMIRLERGFAMTRHEITVGEYRRFVNASGYVSRATHRGHSMAYDVRSGNFVRGSGIDWRSAYDGRPAADDMPVIHVSARDAEAYAAWLTQQTGAYYRLPSEAEFEYALRAGRQTRFPWGADAPPAGVENLTGGDDVSPQGRRWGNAFKGYGDGHWGPAPVGSFAANGYRLHDMGGNVSEWIADCWHEGYRRAPATGAAWVNPGCRNRMYRGGSWASSPAQARSAWRTSGGTDVTNARVGFRLVRQL